MYCALNTELVLHIHNTRSEPQKMCIALQEAAPRFGGAHDVHTGRQGQMGGGGGCSVAHHDVNCEVWPALDVHFEGVVKCQGDLTFM